MRRISSWSRRIATAAEIIWLFALLAGPGGTLHVAFEETLCGPIRAHDADDHRFEATDASSPTHHHDCLVCHGSRLLSPATLALGIAPASFTIVGLHDQATPEPHRDVARSPRGPPTA
jgi:hypothetical protein